MTFAKGWIPQDKDERDHLYQAPLRAGVEQALPVTLSLRNNPNNGPVLNQGQMGTCVPNSNADAFYFSMGVSGVAQVLPSRLYIYYEGREIEGSPVTEDTGMMPRDALKVLASGVPHENLWPYSDANPGPFSEEPEVTSDELIDHAIEYLALQPTLGSQLRGCIVEGHPFTFGFQVPTALESEQMATGAVKGLQMPTRDSEMSGEGHGVECVGYDFSRTQFAFDAFEIKNSWGPEWCDEGYFFLDARFFRSTLIFGSPLASDIWTIRKSN